MEELNGSELGTKEYWEGAYSCEIKNYKDNGDVGEIWFDEDSQLRIIDWILKRSISTDCKIIDLGCGNGMFLIELAREGYKKLTGVDYSSNAIQLAQSIATDQNIHIEYKVVDILKEQELCQLEKYEIVHDKGTYDAISLHPENPKEKRESYINSIFSILSDTGYFVITSCNWTEDELIKSFSSKFQKFCSIRTPSFNFGGKIGNVVTSIVFQIQK